jgi:ankyrin repeat protein
MAREKMLMAVLGILFLLVMPVGAEEIHNAVKQGDIAKVEYLLAKHPEKINAKDEDGKTPLHWAAYYDQTDIAKLLIAEGADVKAKDRENFTPLQWAAGEWEVADFLRGHGGR